VPELPDIAAYIAALEPRVLGERLESVRIGTPFLLRTIRPAVSDAEGDPLADAPNLADRVALRVGNGRPDGPKQERRADANAFERFAQHARFERGDVGRDIRQFRH